MSARRPFQLLDGSQRVLARIEMSLSQLQLSDSVQNGDLRAPAWLAQAESLAEMKLGSVELSPCQMDMAEIRTRRSSGSCMARIIRRSQSIRCEQERRSH